MKARIALAIGATLAVCAFAAPAAQAVAGTPTTDPSALGSALIPPSNFDLATSGWAQQPLIDASDPTVPGITTATVNEALFEFPTGGANFFALSSGAVERAYQPAFIGGTSAFQSPPGAPDRGDANDVSIFKLGVIVPAGGDCLTFDYRFFSTEDPLDVYNDGFLAQLDRSDWSISSDPSRAITAPGNFALTDTGAPASVHGFGAALTPENAAGTSQGAGTPTRKATTPITAGVHQLYLSIFDGNDHAGDTAALVDNVHVGTTANGACGALIPSNVIALGAFKTGKGTASLAATFPGPGAVTVYDAKGPAVTIAKAKKKKKKKIALIKKTTTEIAAAGLVTLKIAPTAAGKAILKKTGKLKVKLAIVFKPTGGTANTVYKTVTVKAKKQKKKKK
jgi:hypothetical protein